MTSAFYKYILTTMVRAAPFSLHFLSPFPLEVQDVWDEDKCGKNKEKGDDG